MSSYYLEVDERSSVAKSFITFLLNYAAKSKDITIYKTPNQETIEAIEEANKGEVINTKTELFEFLDNI